MSKQNKQEKQTIWEKSDTNLLESFCADYRSFISRNKTERECVADMTAVLKEQGAKSLADLLRLRIHERRHQRAERDRVPRLLQH